MAAACRRSRARRPPRRAPRGASPWRRLDAWRLNGQARADWAFAPAKPTCEVDAAAAGAAGHWESCPKAGAWRARAAGRPTARSSASVGGRRIVAAVVPQGEERHVFLDGRSIVLTMPTRSASPAPSTRRKARGLLSPMPGKVIALLARPGAAVEKGAPLLVLEAMKMEHTISAPHAGTVKSFRFAPATRSRRAWRWWSSSRKLRIQILLQDLGIDMRF